MKSIFILAAITAITIAATAQNIGIGTSTPHSSALLDISSTTKGLLPPRLTTAQRNAIAAPAKGMLVYDTDANALYHHNGNGWAVVNGPNMPFSLPYAGGISLQDGAVFEISNTGEGKAISATKTGALNAAVEGRADGQFSIGARGSQTGATGFGVYGANPTGVAVTGISSGSGAAMEAIANNQLAKALLTNGNLRLYGGNTNPSKGAVLTATNINGEAVWKARPQVAFMLTGINYEQRFFIENTPKQVHFKNEDYDLAGNITPTPQTGPTGYLVESTFTVPVDGIYAFDYALEIATYIENIYQSATLELVNDRFGGPIVVDKTEFYNTKHNDFWRPSNKLWLNGSTQLSLKAGDRVFLRFDYNLVAAAPPSPLSIANEIKETNYFSGRLVARL